VKRHMTHQATECVSDRCAAPVPAPAPPAAAAQDGSACDQTGPDMGSTVCGGSVQPCAASAWCCAQDTGDAVEDEAEGTSQDMDAGAVDTAAEGEGEGAPRSKRLTSEECEQRRIDAILHKLFFSSKNQLISEGITYDGSVRYVSHICVQIARCPMDHNMVIIFSHLSLSAQLDQRQGRGGLNNGTSCLTGA
jgi:hypothetical protein